jgi:hypothetical protein
MTAIERGGEPVSDEAQKIAERLHREQCGCGREPDAGWLWFGVAVDDGELTYERAAQALGRGLYSER